LSRCYGFFGVSGCLFISRVSVEVVLFRLLISSLVVSSCCEVDRLLLWCEVSVRMVVVRMVVSVCTSSEVVLFNVMMYMLMSVSTMFFSVVSDDIEWLRGVILFVLV